MLVCLCEGVNQQVLEDAVRGGATTVRELSRRTGAGTGCASCVCDLRAILRRRAVACPVPEPGDEALAAK